MTRLRLGTFRRDIAVYSPAGRVARSKEEALPSTAAMDPAELCA